MPVLFNKTFPNEGLLHKNVMFKILETICTGKCKSYGHGKWKHCTESKF